MDGHLDPVEETRPKQARSRARRAALIERGADLLEGQELDELSVAEMTASLGYSTGSFYSYFKDKEAFFVAVQQWVNEELEDAFDAAFGAHRMAALPLPERLRECVDFALHYFRRRTGVIRSALRYERRIPEGWAPNRQRTRMIVEAATRGLPSDDANRLQIALQLAFGLIVNAPRPHLKAQKLKSHINVVAAVGGTNAQKL